MSDSEKSVRLSEKAWRQNIQAILWNLEFNIRPLVT